MPLPLPMMIPFMGIQSGVMAKMFGENFQFGKRKISAMSNEEFNELTFEKLMKDNAMQIKALIPTFEQSLADMRPFTEFIIREFGVMIQLLIGQAGNQFDKATQTAQDDFYHFMGWGHANTSYHSDGTLHEGATESNPPPPTDPPIDEPEPPTEEPPTEDPINNHEIFKVFTIRWRDPSAGFDKSFTTPELNHAQHHTFYTSILNDTENQIVTNMGGSNSRANFTSVYFSLITGFYHP